MGRESLIGSDRIRTEGLDSCLDAFFSREPVSTSLENAIVERDQQAAYQPSGNGMKPQDR